MKALIPPDKKRCQCVKQLGNPWTIGGMAIREERCHKKPVAIIREKVNGADGRKGSMSLCGGCLREAKTKFKDKVIVIKLKPSKVKNAA